MSLTLTSGHTITFKPYYTHRMECAFKDAINRSMNIKEKDGQVVVEDIKADTLDRAAKAVLPLLIEKIIKDNQDVPYTEDWLLDLPEKDFITLRDHVVSMKLDNEDRKEAGKKISEQVRQTLLSKGKRFPREYALFRFCQEFHALPQDVLEVPDHLYHLFLAFLREEAEADRMEARRKRQHSPR